VNGPNERILTLVHRMTEMHTPLLFWAGYSSSALVSSMYLRAWTVMVSKNPRTRIFPRRWFDLTGKKMSDVWESALKAVVGVVVFRPGVSQVRSLLVMGFVVLTLFLTDRTTLAPQTSIRQTRGQ
jgi:oxalate---CoA ligase